MDALAEDNGGPDLWISAWFTIWTSPRVTIRRIVNADPHKFVLGIAWFVGALTVLDGDPGLGKSTIVLDLAARATRGIAMPGSGTRNIAPRRFSVQCTGQFVPRCCAS